MAIYHLNCRSITRGKNKNIVQSIACRTGSCLKYFFEDKSTNITVQKSYNYLNRNGIIFSKILSPIDEAWSKDRESLWNNVEAKEVRKDAQLAREFTLGLPLELTREQNIILVEKYAVEQLVEKGMIVDISVHYENESNPHVLVVATTRVLNKDTHNRYYFGYKERAWNTKEFLINLRKKWADYLNITLKDAGYNIVLSDKSYKELGIEKIPTIHEGKGARRRKYSERLEINKQIISLNKEKVNKIN